VVGTWRRPSRGRSQTLQVSPFHPVSDELSAIISEVYASLP
jgi:hypothetical protein